MDAALRGGGTVQRNDPDRPQCPPPSTGDPGFPQSPSRCHRLGGHKWGWRLPGGNRERSSRNRDPQRSAYRRTRRGFCGLGALRGYDRDGHSDGLLRPAGHQTYGKYPLALQPNTSSYRHYVERWARRENISITKAFEHTSFDGLLSFALEGACVAMVGAYVPRFSPHANAVRVLKLPNFSLVRSVIAVRALKPDSLTSEFIAFFQNYFDAGAPAAHSDIPNAGHANL